MNGKYWSDGRDVLYGEHEADTGIVATAAGKDEARLIARLLNAHLNAKRIHVMPNDDLHVASMECICKPESMRDDPLIILHKLVPHV